MTSFFGLYARRTTDPTGSGSLTIRPLEGASFDEADEFAEKLLRQDQHLDSLVWILDREDVETLHAVSSACLAAEDCALEEAQTADLFRNHGYEATPTGGGCMAYQKEVPGGIVMIASDASLPASLTEPCGIVFLDREDSGIFCNVPGEFQPEQALAVVDLVLRSGWPIPERTSPAGDYTGYCGQDNWRAAAALAEFFGGNWEEHPHFCRSDWQYEVSNNDTTRSYWDHVASQVEMALDDITRQDSETLRAFLVSHAWPVPSGADHPELVWIVGKLIEEGRIEPPEWS